MSKDLEILGEFECPTLNQAYMAKLAEECVRIQPDLLELGRKLEEKKFLQTTRSPGLRATIFKRGNKREIICPYTHNNGIFCTEKLGDRRCYVRYLLQD